MSSPRAPAIHTEGLYTSACGHESLGKQLAGNQLLVQSIMQETFRIQVDGNLFSPFSTHGESSHTADATQTVLQLIHIVGQFPIRLVLAFHGNQQCRCVAKIIHHLYGKHIRRKLRLEGGYSMLELAPELIFVVQFVIQLYLHKNNPVARGRKSSPSLLPCMKRCSLPEASSPVPPFH